MHKWVDGGVEYRVLSGTNVSWRVLSGPPKPLYGLSGSIVYLPDHIEASMAKEIVRLAAEVDRLNNIVGTFPC